MIIDTLNPHILLFKNIQKNHSEKMQIHFSKPFDYIKARILKQNLEIKTHKLTKKIKLELDI